MGIFGGKDERDAEIEALRGQIEEGIKVRKRLAATLAEECKRSAELTAQIDVKKTEIERLKAALIKARQRQKASVERANRYKSRLVAVAAVNP